MSGTDARAIARAFLPVHPLGNRWDYFYSLGKLRSDPLYPGVIAALRGSTAPLMDLGCGLGLLAHALRHDGQDIAYRGVDNDAAKIRRGQQVADRKQLQQVHFDYLDLAHEQPEHRGSVAILDVLQYLDADAQAALIRRSAAMLTDDARLVIRVAIADDSGRGRTTRITDRLANLIGWMQSTPRAYPDAGRFRSLLHEAGLQTRFSPLYGNTPFNNWLIVAQPR